jgi:hypothetical protein
MVGSPGGPGEDDDGLGEDEVPIDLGQDEGNIDLDDENSPGLDIGLKLVDPKDSGETADAADLDVDVSDMISIEDPLSHLGDEEAGPAGFDHSSGVLQIVTEEWEDDALGVAGAVLDLTRGM